MNERGFTLAELLVSCAVIAFVVAGVFTLQRQGQLVYLWGAARVEVQQGARQALDMMMRELRTALTVTSCSATSIAFTDASSNAITYSVSGATLLRDAPGVSSPNNALIDGLSSLAITCFTSDGYTTTTTASAVRSVMIAIQTQGGGSSTGGIQKTAVQDRVKLRNL
jgi:prepilin-type N-terminal cleavage/methylation domain-containing protein